MATKQVGELAFSYDHTVLEPRPWTAVQAEWAAALADKYMIRVPTLARDTIAQDPPKQITIRYQSQDWSGYSPTVEVPGRRYRVKVPFDGEADVFKIAASRRRLTNLEGRVDGGLSQT